MHDSAITEQVKVNGIDVGGLTGTIEAVREQPDLADMQFRASNEWVGGTHNRTSINGVYGAGTEQIRETTFVLEKDEPAFLLGTDIGANPVEHLLAALAGCLTTTLVFMAAAEGVKLDKITSKVEGDGSLLGFLGLDENTRMGCDAIRVRFEIESEEPRERIADLLDLAQSRSGVFDMIANRVPVSVDLA